MTSMATASAIDIGYPWWLSYGHLTILIPSLLALFAGRIRKWPRWTMAMLALIAVWSGAAFLVVYSLGLNRLGELPTRNFLRGAGGRVLDLGAGTGRSSIMVLQARPQVSLVALDLFAESYTGHFGSHGDPRERLRRNLAAAGVDSRVSIVTGDMRKLAFGDQSFEGVVSAYAVDHLGQAGIEETLHEAYRVLKPGGEFLLMLVANDARTRFAFGPLLSHGGLRGPQWWAQRAGEAGFHVAEQGTAPATLYFVLKRPVPEGRTEASASGEAELYRRLVSTLSPAMRRTFSSVSASSAVLSVR